MLQIKLQYPGRMGLPPLMKDCSMYSTIEIEQDLCHPGNLGSASSSLMCCSPSPSSFRSTT